METAVWSTVQEDSSRIKIDTNSSRNVLFISDNNPAKASFINRQDRVTIFWLQLYTDNRGFPSSYVERFTKSFRRDLPNRGTNQAVEKVPLTTI